MSGFEVTRVMAASPDRVFAAATDLTGAAERITGITKMEVLTDGPVSAGTRFRETRVMFGREATEEMEIQDFDPPRRYSLLAENHGCRYLSEFRFDPEGDGTKVTFEFEAVPLTFFAKIMMVLTKPLQKSMVKLCVQDLEDLRASVEA